jgi:hypothetical protein
MRIIGETVPGALGHRTPLQAVLQFQQQKVSCSVTNVLDEYTWLLASWARCYNKREVLCFPRCYG